MPNSRKKVFRRAIIKKSATGRRITPASIQDFLEVEKATLNFLKPLVLLFFTFTIGAIAALFETQKYKIIMAIFTLGLFISLLFLMCSLSKFRSSIFKIHESRKIFLQFRKISYRYLLISLYILLISFELSIIIYNNDYIENICYCIISKFKR